MFLTPPYPFPKPCSKFLDGLQVEDVVLLCWQNGNVVHRIPTEITRLTGDSIWLHKERVLRDSGHSDLKRIRSDRMFWIEAIGSMADRKSATALVAKATLEREWWLYNLKAGEDVVLVVSESGLVDDLNLKICTITKSVQGKIWLKSGSKKGGSTYVFRRTGFSHRHIAWLEAATESIEMDSFEPQI